VVISKSGNTPETLIQIIAAIEAVRAAGLGDRVPELFLGLTEPRSKATNGLRDLCEALAIPMLPHDPGIGGRFSGLTNVGLLPALARGLNVEALRKGAHGVIEGLLTVTTPKDFAPALGAAVIVGLAKERGVKVSVMLPYADRLSRFAAWYVQLWGESLGKKGEGTTPVAALGPVDQHSQLQLYLDGAAQQKAIPEALIAAGRPVRTIDLERLDERTLGGLMMHFMLETILAGHLLGVDPFDQPAVESGKIITRRYLGG
jgi:glucose-6-phosphate isomerase